MPLVAAKCTQCGASLTVDSSQDAAICPVCQTPFITEKAINNYNTTNITNIGSLNADTVNIVDSNSAENVLKAGETFLRLSDYNSARLKFEEMCQRFPYDERGWYGLLMSLTTNFTTAKITIEFHAKLIDIFEKYCIVGNSDNIKNNMRDCRNFILRVGEMIYEQQIENRKTAFDEAEMLAKSFVESLENEHKNKNVHIPIFIVSQIYKKLHPEEKDISFGKLAVANCGPYGTVSFWCNYIEKIRNELQQKIDALKTNNDKLEMITAKYVK